MKMQYCLAPSCFCIHSDPSNELGSRYRPCLGLGLKEVSTKNKRSIIFIFVLK